MCEFKWTQDARRYSLKVVPSPSPHALGQQAHARHLLGAGCHEEHRGDWPGLRVLGTCGGGSGTGWWGGVGGGQGESCARQPNGGVGQS